MADPLLAMEEIASPLGVGGTGAFASNSRANWYALGFRIMKQRTMVASVE